MQLLLVLLTLLAAAPWAQARPNVLFILADQFRADALGAAGHPFVKTPHLDRLARQGVLFANAYVPQALCGPARASLLTGVYPMVHGVRDNLYNIDSAFRMPGHELRPNWPEMLRQAGYYSGYIGKWHLGEADPGMFNDYRGYNSQWPHWLGEKYSSVYRPDQETDRALEFLDENRGRPFSLIVSYYPPHDPFEAPRRFHSLYQDQGIDQWEYYAAVSALDWNVGRMLERLDQLGLAENTLVIFTSDHGETFGRYPYHPHKRVSYEDSARVPMIIRYPAGLPAGVVYQGGVLNMDLMPTILEAAGQPIPGRVTARSLLSNIRSGRTGWDQPVFHLNVFRRAGADQPQLERMVRWRQWKLILRDRPASGAPPRDELFDLDADPQEKTNLLNRPEWEAKRRELARMLQEWGQRSQDPVSVELARRYAN